ncbi:hypothetical protein [Williamsia sp. DF01-3]|uniref:hypothetical protein n=1 Tax=Williamsia sp. DF01-3 TaxID=2934157 RepID=UPI001FF369B1|nr:hypothetical protein [Williamsia sp. DF01-3]MCK0515711.1 hypothetical protein [Williamsia sp. DF01-3]
MRTITPRPLASAAAATVAAAAWAITAPIAAAAPGDVTLSTPSVNGNTVTATIANNSADDIVCTSFGADAGNPNPATTQSARLLFDTPEIPAGTTGTYTYLVYDGDAGTSAGVTEIPDGYYDIYWTCTAALPGDERWGTPPLLTAEEATATHYRNIQVGAPTPEPEPEPTCFGSVCLP